MDEFTFDEEEIEDVSLEEADQCPSCGIVTVSGSTPGCKDPEGCGEDTLDEDDEEEYIDEDEEDTLLEELDFGE